MKYEDLTKGQQLWQEIESLQRRIEVLKTGTVNRIVLNMIWDDDKNKQTGSVYIEEDELPYLEEGAFHLQILIRSLRKRLEDMQKEFREL